MIFSCDVEREKAETEAICDLRYFHTPDDEANAALIVALVNNLPAILSALEAVPVMKEAMTALRDDMLRRAEANRWQNDGELVVECGTGVWIKFNQALAALEGKS
jgi:hypothetical protein